MLQRRMVSDDKRRSLIGRIADHLLTQGLAGASLRPMAAAAGTSDRLLLFYFPDREAVLGAALEEVAGRMSAGLAALVPEPLAYSDLLRTLRTALRGPDLAPYMHLWLEVAARGARGEQPCRTIGEAIGRGFLAWAAERLRTDGEAASDAQAALLLATLDGLALLDSVGLHAAADAALPDR